MSNEQVLAKLKELHQQLQEVQQTLVQDNEHSDEKTVSAVETLSRDIASLLEATHDDLPPQAINALEEHQSLADRLREFDSEHPQLSRLINQIGEALASIGI